MSQLPVSGVTGDVGTGLWGRRAYRKGRHGAGPPRWATCLLLCVQADEPTSLAPLPGLKPQRGTVTMTVTAQGHHGEGALARAWEGAGSVCGVGIQGCVILGYPGDTAALWVAQAGTCSWTEGFPVLTGLDRRGCDTQQVCHSRIKTSLRLGTGQ